MKLNFAKIIKLFNNKTSIDEIEQIINHISKWDRYQASFGINKAAIYIKKFIKRIGLEQVNLYHCTLKNKNVAWSFRSPKKWSPMRAKLEIEINKRNILLSSYPETSCMIATNSCVINENGYLSDMIVNPINFEKCANKIVIITKKHMYDKKLFNKLVESKIKGFITDYSCKIVKNRQYIGRLELPINTKMFGFNITEKKMAILLKNYNNRQCTYNININISTKFNMPIVSGYIPGKSKQELLLIAHLCHPKPGANDNASGIATLLLLSNMLIQYKKKLNFSIRFLWMPEFVGSAYYLFEIIKYKKLLPIYVINLDMLASNQTKFQSSTIIEKAPIYLPNCLDPVFTEAIKSSISIFKRNYTWRWNISNFKGMSDHLLFADPFINVPTIQISEQPDPYNHTNGDALNRYNLKELKRIIVAITSAIYFICVSKEQDFEHYLKIIFENKYAQLKEFYKSSLINLIIKYSQTNNLNVNLSDINEILLRQHLITLRYFTHLYPKANKQLIMNYYKTLEIEIKKKYNKLKFNVSNRRDENILIKCWKGPFNLYSALEAMDKNERIWIKDKISSNKNNYSHIISLMLFIDNQTSFTRVWLLASINLNEFIDYAFAKKIFSILKKVKWIKIKKANSNQMNMSKEIISDNSSTYSYL